MIDFFEQKLMEYFGEIFFYSIIFCIIFFGFLIILDFIKKIFKRF